ncbi:hypothetical protein OROMI_002346 [Orobanche minor]
MNKIAIIHARTPSYLGEKTDRKMWSKLTGRTRPCPLTRPSHTAPEIQKATVHKTFRLDSTEPIDSTESYYSRNAKRLLYSTK